MNFANVTLNSLHIERHLLPSPFRRSCVKRFFVSNTRQNVLPTEKSLPLQVEYIFDRSSNVGRVRLSTISTVRCKQGVGTNNGKVKIRIS